jgi:hypothetical protein
VINPNGSEDHLIHIKGIKQAEISFEGCMIKKTIPIEDLHVEEDEDEEFGLDGDEDTIQEAIRRHFTTYTVEDLRSRLRASKLPISGLKKVLIERLVTYEAQKHLRREAIRLEAIAAPIRAIADGG